VALRRDLFPQARLSLAPPSSWPIALRAPPIPPDILTQLQQNNFVLEESFTIYDKADPTPTLSKKR
jgi:hypothetical protein